MTALRTFPIQWFGIEFPIGSTESTLKTIKTILEEFRTGRTVREDFWREMQERHLQLREYQAQIAGTELEAIEIRGDQLRVRTNEGIWMLWEPEDLGMAPNALVNYGTYEPAESAYLLEAGSGAHVIFDIGANVGFYSLHWALRLAPGGSIHAFEPVPSTFSWLRRNTVLNKLDGVIRANDFGLADEAKRVSMFLPRFTGSGGASMKNLHPEEATVEVEVRFDTLDEYFSANKLRRLDLLKADVEGSEILVLRGGLRTIEEHRPLIFLELLRKWSRPFGYHPNDVIRMLGQIGYRSFTFGEDGLFPFNEMDEETIQKNFFFAHPLAHGSWLSAHRLI